MDNGTDHSAGSEIVAILKDGALDPLNAIERIAKAVYTTGRAIDDPVEDFELGDEAQQALASVVVAHRILTGRYWEPESDLNDMRDELRIELDDEDDE
jgi:hypothetical protein